MNRGWIIWVLIVAIAASLVAGLIGNKFLMLLTFLQMFLSLVISAWYSERAKRRRDAPICASCGQKVFGKDTHAKRS